MRRIATITIIAVILISHLGFADRPNNFVLDCTSTFPPDTTAATLSNIYGLKNVTAGDVDVGEGFRKAATILFADNQELRLEIFWKDVESKQRPSIIRIRHSESNWHTGDGLSVGSDLLTVEKINGLPFRLAGFGWDYPGTTASWSGGRLAASTSSNCKLVVRFAPDNETAQADLPSYRQVLGSRAFSSGHPAMQALNPRVYEVQLVY